MADILIGKHTRQAHPRTPPVERAEGLRGDTGDKQDRPFHGYSAANGWAMPVYCKQPNLNNGVRLSEAGSNSMHEADSERGALGSNVGKIDKIIHPTYRPIEKISFTIFVALVSLLYK